MTKPITDGIGDARTPPDEVQAGRLKVPADADARIPCRDLLSEPSTKTGDWSRPDRLLNSLVNLLASAHRVPHFLIAQYSGQDSTGSASPVSERILTKWLRHADLLLGRGQLSELGELIARLGRAADFLFELANALDCRLRDVHTRRRDVLAAHSAITCSWLEASPIYSIAEISEQWHQLLIEDHNRRHETAIVAAGDLPDHERDRGVELAWQLMQTHRLGEEFRQAHTRLVGTST